MIHLSVSDTAVRGFEVAIYEAIMHRMMGLLFHRRGQHQLRSFFDRQGFVGRSDLARNHRLGCLGGGLVHSGGYEGRFRSPGESTFRPLLS